MHRKRLDACLQKEEVYRREAFVMDRIDKAPPPPQFHDGTATSVPMKKSCVDGYGSGIPGDSRDAHNLYANAPLYVGHVDSKCYNLLAAPAGK